MGGCPCAVFSFQITTQTVKVAQNTQCDMIRLKKKKKKKRLLYKAFTTALLENDPISSIA